MRKTAVRYADDFNEGDGCNRLTKPMSSFLVYIFRQSVFIQTA
ncbi:hypothetical protein SALWKB12_1923 [Snodgrassella communis]|nr:hypothetical protein SALWKB12_1923 [Snodgrassella communis]